MNKELFAKKITVLRKKYHYTQQELADKLNISNKTVSRWERAEGYPDLEILPILANLYHVSVDYLLSDHEEYQDIDKTNIASFIPWFIGIVGIFVYYISIKLSIPILFDFIVYFFIIQLSYLFLNKYTDKKNYHSLVLLNSISGFFVFQSFILDVLIYGYVMLTFNTIAINEISITDISILTNFNKYYLISYIAGAIYAFLHFRFPILYSKFFHKIHS